MRKPSRNLPVASKTSVLAAEKTGQVLVRTSPHPGHTESPVISGKKVGYVRRSEAQAPRRICSALRSLRPPSDLFRTQRLAIHGAASAPWRFRLVKPAGAAAGKSLQRVGTGEASNCNGAREFNPNPERSSLGSAQAEARSLSHFVHPPRTRPESETVLEWQRPHAVAQGTSLHFTPPSPVGWGEALLARRTQGGGFKPT